jgi:hypothetical protein
MQAVRDLVRRAPDRLRREIGYISLSMRANQLARQRYAARQTGSMFSGGAPPTEVTMEKLLEAQAK